MPWPCFWVELNGEQGVWLRRYRAYSEPKAWTCEEGWHDAKTFVEYTARGSIPVEEYAGDARWPITCGRCDYVFSDDDKWQVWTDNVYATLDASETWFGLTLPVGALYDATWLPDAYRGADGIALTVVLPPDSDNTHVQRWHVDGPASGGGRWTRSGDPRATPPTVHADPSIKNGDPGWEHFYHGHMHLIEGRTQLTDGSSS